MKKIIIVGIIAVIAIVLMLVIYGDPEYFDITKQYSDIVDRFYENSGGSWPYSIIVFDLSSGEAVQLVPVNTIGSERTTENSVIELSMDGLVLKTSDGVNSKFIFELPYEITIILFNDEDIVCVFSQINNDCSIKYESGDFEYGLYMSESYFEEYETAILKVKLHIIKPKE